MCTERGHSDLDDNDDDNDSDDDDDDDNGCAARVAINLKDNLRNCTFYCDPRRIPTCDQDPTLHHDHFDHQHSHFEVLMGKCINISTIREADDRKKAVRRDMILRTYPHI